MKLNIFNMKKLLLFILICFYLSEMAYCQTKSIGWIELNSGTMKKLNSVYCINKDTIIAVGAMGTILRTINGGILWDSIYSTTNNELLSVKFIDQTIGFIVGSNGTILKTFNSGINWTNIGITNMMLLNMYFLNSDTGWVVGGNSGTVPIGSKGIILKTFNGGINWILDSTFNKTVSSIFFIDKDTGYYSAQNSSDPAVIFKTTNGGYNWNNVYTSNGFNYYFDKLQFTSAKTGYINGYEEILKTDDYGLTWNSIFIAYPNAIFSFQIMDSCSFYFADKEMNGANICIYDFCNNITNYCYNISNLYGLHFIDKDYGFAVGWKYLNIGAILKRGYYDAINEEKKNDHIIIMPNPFNDRIIINIPKEYIYKINFNISIYNSLGNCVFEINKSSNSNSIDLDLPNYLQGIYFLVIKKEKQILQSFKLIKI